MNYYCHLKSPLGKIYLLANDSALIALDFEKTPLYSNAELNADLPVLKKSIQQLNEYFMGKRKVFDLKIEPSGTNFQQTAWNTLLKIPFGEVISYGEQAILMNKPNAQRAAGSANGKNPIPIIIPCHRIITANNKIGGYSGGLEIKIKLLKHEGHSIKNGHIT